MSRSTSKAETDGLLRPSSVTAAPAADRAAFAGKGIAWATRQGTNDRNAGTECRKYKNFLSIYKLPRSPFTLHMWNAYLLARQATPKNAARLGGRHKLPTQADPPRKPIPAVVGPEWAARQAREDRITGKACLSYEAFLRAYDLRKSDASRRVWKIYNQHANLVPRNTPPKSAQKLHWTRGLTLSDASAHRRTVRRYDRIEPRRSDLSPGNAALLMKVNQQNTLVDMWR
jgi:hypothetical protein